MKTSVIFVHGLGGSKNTWGKFPELIKADPDLKIDVDFMEYPSPPLGLKLFFLIQHKYQAIEDLAKSLKTLIDEKHHDADEIVLVGHSMGGLVIRKYLLEAKVAGSQSKVSKAILYATPNRGCGYATLLKEFSPFRNPHLWQLSNYSDFIKLLNESWCRSRIDAVVDITVVVAGNDKVVTVDSAEGVFQHLEPKQIAGKGHLDVVKPESAADLSFTIFRNAILKKKYLPELQLQGGCNFIAWQKYPGLTKFAFRLDEKRRTIFDSLMQSEFIRTRADVRIKGLSGLGKTRLVHEAILASDQEIKDKVVYINVATENPGLKSWLKRAVDLGYQGILVVDNCKPDLHKDLSEEVGRDDSRIVLVTLDHGLDTLSGTSEYRIEPFETADIKAMLEPYCGDRISDLDRVAAFAQGFPQMAVLIADARIANDPQVGKLSDDQLAKKLLGEIDQTELSILRGCSLFDRFGCEGDVSAEYKYIAEAVVKVSTGDFYKCIKKFKDRGLIDISGRYGQLVPKPLAVRLASEWWNETHGDDQISLIQEIPGNLIEPFCYQITMLGFIEEVREMTRALCGPQAPFGQAEVILSNRGSRLLRAFVEVNPIDTSLALLRVLDHLAVDELGQISGDVRRNLVWALEKLAFHASVFEQAAGCLMLLATAENESFSNNATGMFSQLFRVNLSGTEADFGLRLRVLKSAIELNDRNVDRVIIKALSAAISNYGSRTIGAEYQGNRPPLEEWRPKVWQEIFDYWSATFEMLLKFVEGENENSQEAQNIIGHSIRQMTASGRIEMLDEAINRVVKLNGRYWPSALESIKSSLAYDSKGLPDKGIAALNRWLDLLSPDKANLPERLKIVVVNPPWEHQEDEDGHYVDVAARNAEQLAYELSGDIGQLTEYLPLLLLGEQKQAFAFGRQLAIESENVGPFFDRVLHRLEMIERPNLSLAKGLLTGIYFKSVDEWNRRLEEFASRKELIKFYPDMVCTGQMQSPHLAKLLKLIEQGQLRANCASILSYGSVTSHLSSHDLSTFCLELASINDEGAWSALDIIFMYCFGDSNKFDENRDALKALVTKVPLNKKSKGGQSDMYHWSEVAKKLLVSESLPFCKDICQQMIAATKEGFNHGDIWHYIKPLLIDLMRFHGKEVWPIFSDAIISADSTKLYWLQQLLDRENSFSNVQPSIFSILPLDFVIEWCKQHPEFAPLFVARCINVFEQDANGLQEPTPLFVALLENFGDAEGFGSELTANLGTKGWSGSLVPYLEADKAALTPLLQHANKNVRAWVKQHIDYLDKCITYESMRDDERKLGVY